ncbi:unnamed protein product [Rotaria magnacalcarata]|uniref:Uncharacterized protein n=2 Tax=Rotaria magnacalcarata TaxID=392030 RepID=A0A819C5I3_9BILA|nr:unnamed protein product [Rotaria magnacalcarata]CAF3815018.1 unnamed protein product [Rotaria magnacalcarata]
MLLFPTTGLARFLLAVIIISTISYMVLNIVSFAGTPWITTNVENIQFGLWKVCNQSVNGSCYYWTNSAIPGGKPYYIRSSQALEIISLIFYVFAAGLILIGILNVDGVPYHFVFIGAAALLLVAITFISATLGVMSVQGRLKRISAFLDWAWWNGLIGLIMTITCCFSLIAFVLDMKLSGRNRQTPKSTREPRQNNVFVASQAMSYPMSAPVTSPMNYENYQGYNYQHPNDYFPVADNNLNGYDSNPPLTYGDQYPWNQYSNNQTPSPMISDLAREYMFRASNAQYGQPFQPSY